MRTPSELEIHLNALARLGQFDDLMTSAADVLASADAMAHHKFIALVALILRHPRFDVALDMILHRLPEISIWPDYFRYRISIYLVQLAHSPDELGLLPHSYRPLVEDAERYYRSHPEPRERQLAEALLAEQQQKEKYAPTELILSAVRSKTPWSVVRMGDGEGRFVLPLDGYSAIQTEAESIAKRLWFWNSSSSGDDDFFRALRTAYKEASIVGTNPPYRVSFEYRNSPLGYVGVVNGNRFIAGSEGKGVKVVNWLFEAAGEGFFRELLQAADSVTFVGPHREEIADRLQAFGAKVVSLVRTPSDNLVPNALDTPHFPERYREIVEILRRGNFGDLTLISAGAYAKIYANEVQRAGGIGLDIGSLSDKWIGLKTR